MNATANAVSLRELIDKAAARKRAANPEWVARLREAFGIATVLNDEETLLAHSYDAWPLCAKWKNTDKCPYSPDVVIKADSAAQISAILKWANEHKVPVTPWGGGSSVTGQPLPTEGGIVLDLTAMDKLLALNEYSLTVKVQAGMFGDRLERELNTRGYTLNHSPQSLDRSTVGGWVSTRAMGQLSSRYGGIEDLTVTFTVVLPTGEIVELLNTPRGALGPDLRHVFMGAEGCMGLITDVTLRVFPLPQARILEAVTFASVADGVTAMRLIMRAGLRPALVRFYDRDEAKHAMRDISFDSCVMFLGFEAIETVAQAEYTAAMNICTGCGGRRIGPEAVEAWRQRRYDFSTVEDLLAKPGGLAETIEVAHFWHGIMDTYTALKKALTPYAAEVLGHFSHVYDQGTSLYIILLGQDESDEVAESKLLEIWDVAMRTCLQHGACIAHHHGSGLARVPYVRPALGTGLQVLGKMKAALDPNGIMNPGKLGL